MDLQNYWNQPGGGEKWGESKLSYKMLLDFAEWLRMIYSNEFTLLDIGSGTGRLFNTLSREGISADVQMIDFAELGRKKCFDNTGHLPETWDGKILPYGDEVFDIVVMMDLLLHVHPDQLEQLWSEAVRVSKGLLYFNITLWEQPKIDDSTWCFSHADTIDDLYMPKSIIVEKKYIPKNPKNTVFACVVTSMDVEEVEGENDISEVEREDDRDTGEVDSPSSDESSVSDDREVG